MSITSEQVLELIKRLSKDTDGVIRLTAVGLGDFAKIDLLPTLGGTQIHICMVSRGMDGSGMYFRNDYEGIREAAIKFMEIVSSVSRPIKSGSLEMQERVRKQCEKNPLQLVYG